MPLDLAFAVPITQILRHRYSLRQLQVDTPGVTTFGPNLASSVAGAPQAERQAVTRSSREARDRDRARKSDKDNPEAPVDKVELTEAVRSLKDNTQEETRDDRQEHPQYGAGGRLVKGRRSDQPSLDLEV